MGKKNIYQATFEESEFLVTEKTVKRAIEESKPKVVKKRFFGVTLVFIIFYLMYSLLRFLENGSSDSINILSLRIPYFWLFFSILIIVPYYSFSFVFFNRKKIALSFFYNFCMIIYLYLLSIFSFLFLLSLVNFLINTIWMDIPYTVLLLLFVFSFNRKLNIQIYNQLYGENKGNSGNIFDFFSKYRKILSSLAGILIFGKTLQSLFFKNNNPSQINFFQKILGVLSPFIIFIFLLIPIYMKDEVLVGYYLYKYPEQYRLKYGYSVLEWYGPKSKQYKKEMKNVDKN